MEFIKQNSCVFSITPTTKNKETYGTRKAYFSSSGGTAQIISANRITGNTKNDFSDESRKINLKSVKASLNIFFISIALLMNYFT